MALLSGRHRDNCQQEMPRLHIPSKSWLEHKAAVATRLKKQIGVLGIRNVDTEVIAQAWIDRLMLMMTGITQTTTLFLKAVAEAVWFSWQAVQCSWQPIKCSATIVQHCGCGRGVVTHLVLITAG